MWKSLVKKIKIINCDSKKDNIRRQNEVQLFQWVIERMFNVVNRLLIIIFKDMVCNTGNNV
jgi:hypothetical protein